MDAGSITQNYQDTRSASVDRRQRIDLLDLKDQLVGEAHIFFKSKIVRANMFTPFPKPVKKMRLNQFLKIEPPTDFLLMEFDKRFKQFIQVFSDPNFEMPASSENRDITILMEAFEKTPEQLKPFERGVTALIALLENEVSKQRELSAPYETKEVSGVLSIFTKVPVSALTERIIGVSNKDLFSLPLLRRGSTVEELKHMERLMGNSEERSIKISNALVEELEYMTTFPQEPVRVLSTPAELLADLNRLIVQLGGEAEAGTGAPTPTPAAAFSDLPDLSQASIDLGSAADAGAALPPLPDLPDLPEDTE
jgi:intracellular multiplication protein IcmO